MAWAKIILNRWSFCWQIWLIEAKRGRMREKKREKGGLGYLGRFKRQGYYSTHTSHLPAEGTLSVSTCFLLSYPSSSLSWSRHPPLTLCALLVVSFSLILLFFLSLFLSQECWQYNPQLQPCCHRNINNIPAQQHLSALKWSYGVQVSPSPTLTL